MAGRATAAGKRKMEDLQQRPPLWMVIVNRAYHKYGLKHLVLIVVFLAYTTFGGLIFWLFEEPYQSKLQEVFNEKIAFDRTIRVEKLMKRVFNNRDCMIYIKGNTLNRLAELLKNTSIALTPHWITLTS